MMAIEICDEGRKIVNGADGHRLAKAADVSRRTPVQSQHTPRPGDCVTPMGLRVRGISGSPKTDFNRHPMLRHQRECG